jgi:hypothetical protein
METLDPASVDLVVREALDELLQCNPRLKAGEGRTQTEVDAVAKCKVAFNRAISDVAVWIGECPWVTVGSPVDEQDD